MYAARMLRRRPVATASAALSLTIGIGLNAAVFSVVDWVLLRSLPYPASSELSYSSALRGSDADAADRLCERGRVGRGERRGPCRRDGGPRRARCNPRSGSSEAIQQRPCAANRCGSGAQRWAVIRAYVRLVRSLPLVRCPLASATLPPGSN
jgi:hypothetical protein